MKMRVPQLTAVFGLALSGCLSLQAAALRIGSIAATNGGLRLSIQSDLNVTNQIQWSPDLAPTNWTVLTNLLVSQSPYQFVDSTPPSPGAARFYRAVALYPPPPPPQSGMALIPAGPFTMGNCMDPNEGNADELPLHTVTVSAFYMETNLVTYALWLYVYQWATNNGYAFSFSPPAQGKAPNHPAQYMFWNDAVKWCNARSELEGRTPAFYTDASQTEVYRTGRVTLDNSFVNWNAGYRLPTEAEWEKAARGGLAGHRFPCGDLITQTNSNYHGASGYNYDASSTFYNPAFTNGPTPYTSTVAYFAPNGYGLHDMAGNVDEWCWDWYDTYPSGPQTDPRGPDAGPSRVYRGGAWSLLAFYARTAHRSNSGYSEIASFDLGFRCVLPHL